MKQTALKRWIVNDKRWNKKAVSRMSLMQAEIRRPSACVKKNLRLLSWCDRIIIIIIIINGCERVRVRVLYILCKYDNTMFLWNLQWTAMGSRVNVDNRQCKCNNNGQQHRPTDLPVGYSLESSCGMQYVPWCSFRSLVYTTTIIIIVTFIHTIDISAILTHPYSLFPWISSRFRKIESEFNPLNVAWTWR